MPHKESKAQIKAQMTSRERILAALRREDVDYLPCSIYFNPNLQVQGYHLADWKEGVRLKLDLGTDPVVGIGVPAETYPEVCHCVEVFGKSGFILGVTNSIRNHFPWENTLAMIDEWKKVR